MKISNNKSAGIGAVWTSGTSAVVDVFETIGYSAKSTKSLSVAGLAKAQVVMLEAIGETLETLGYDIEKMSPAEVIKAWQEMQSTFI